MLSPLRATADLLAFGADGSARASGWTFHGVRPNWVMPDDAAVVLAPATRASSPTDAAANIQNLIRRTALRHERNRALATAGLSKTDWHILFQAMIEAESSYNPSAVSPKGAYGLGQLMPATARALGVDPHDMAQNLDGAARYFLAQLAAFQDVDLALAAYNAGPHRVVQYSGIPPFAETRSYIARIHRIRSRLSGQPASQPSLRIASTAPVRPPLVIDLN
jgi:Transglycosylase SLT domain